MIHWLERAELWSGESAGVLVTETPDLDARRSALHALAARALNLAPTAVLIRHAPGAAPKLERPAGRPLSLSSSCRGGLSCVAAASWRIGVDVEVAEDAEPPWNVLHPVERRVLEQLTGGERAVAFAVTWALKEAYLKALGVGLAREPASFAVRLVQGERTIEDPLRPGRPTSLAWRQHGRAAVAAVVLPDEAP